MYILIYMCVYMYKQRKEKSDRKGDKTRVCVVVGVSKGKRTSERKERKSHNVFMYINMYRCTCEGVYIYMYVGVCIYI